MTGNNCDEALEELYGYLDGELTEERRALIGAHIDDCTPCFDAFDFETSLFQQRFIYPERNKEKEAD